MNRQPIHLILLAATLTLLPTPATAVQPDPPVSCSGLEGLVTSVDELVSALKASIDQQSHQQELLIAIQYLQFRSRSIESLEEEVRQTEDQVASTRDRVDRMKGDFQLMEKQLSDSPSEEIDSMVAAIDRYRRMIQSEENRLDRYERQIIDMQNRIIDSRRQLLALEDFIAENLDLGQ